MFKKAWLIPLIILLTAATLQVVQASFILTLNVQHNVQHRLKNDLGENILVHGNLTLNGLPVTDGLVTMQIDDPHDSLFILRTLPTGGTPAGPWLVEILEFITVDNSGNAESNFEVNGNMGINITVKNNSGSSQHVNVTLNLYYSNSVPFTAERLFETDISPGKQESRTITHIPIPYDAIVGPAFAYASVLNEWPKNGGHALSPEKSAAFNIVSSKSGETVIPQGFQTTSEPGEYNLTFCTNGYGGILGNYTVFAVSQYEFSYVTNQTTFEVFLLADVTDDDKVRIDDILAVALAFGTEEGDPDWDPIYDLTGDDKVRIDDVLIAALAFGKEGTR